MTVLELLGTFIEVRDILRGLRALDLLYLDHFLINLTTINIHSLSFYNDLSLVNHQILRGLLWLICLIRHVGSIVGVILSRRGHWIGIVDLWTASVSVVWLTWGSIISRSCLIWLICVLSRIITLG